MQGQLLRLSAQNRAGGDPAYRIRRPLATPPKWLLLCRERLATAKPAAHGKPSDVQVPAVGAGSGDCLRARRLYAAEVFSTGACT